MPCILPTGILAATAGAAGGLAGNILSNWLQQHLDQRENAPSLPDRNHDLLRIMANAVSHEIGEYQRNHPHTSGRSAKQLSKLANDCPKSLLALFETGEFPDIAPPDAKALLTASARDQFIPAVGTLDDWLTIIRHLCSHTGVILTPDTEAGLAVQLHAHLWESVRKALKRDFAQDGKGYAALHLQFMGDVMARLDDLTQPHRDLAAATNLTRELIKELRHYKVTEADPKARRIIEKAPPGTQKKLHILMQRYEQLSTRVDRGFDKVLQELRAADRASRSRDQTTHRRLGWALAGLAGIGLISIVAYLTLRTTQQKQQDTAEQVQKDIAGLRTDVQASTLSLDAFRIEATALVDRYLAANYELSETIKDRDAEIERIASALREAQAAADDGDELAEQALAEVRRTGDLKLLQETISRLADTQYARDQEHFEDRQEKYIERCREIASIANIRGDMEEAEFRFQEILRIKPDDLSSINQLGRIFLIQGEMAKAESNFRHILGITPNHAAWQAESLQNLGHIERNRGNFNEAEDMYKRSLEHLHSLDRKEQKASVFGSLGQLYLARGEFDRAKEIHTISLEIYKLLKNAQGQADQTGNLGLVALRRGDFLRAEPYFQESIELNRITQNLHAQAQQLGNLGIVEREKGNLDAAMQKQLQALDIFTSIGDIESQALVLTSVAWIFQSAGELEECSKYMNEALKLFRQIDNLEGQAAQLGNLGSIAHLSGNVAEAIRLWEASRDLYIKMGSLHMAKQIQDAIELISEE